MTWELLRDIMAIGSPLVAFIVLVAGLRFHAKAAVAKDAEHDEKIARVEDQIQVMAVLVATLKERSEGLRTHLDKRFDAMDRQISEIFRRLNK